MSSHKAQYIPPYLLPEMGFLEYKENIICISSETDRRNNSKQVKLL